MAGALPLLPGALPELPGALPLLPGWFAGALFTDDGRLSSFRALPVLFRPLDGLFGALSTGRFA